MTTRRWVRRDRRISNHSACCKCGTCWGGAIGGAKTGGACEPTTCLACGTVQCMGNGLGRGTCAVCYVGFLEWRSRSARVCGYKGCSNPAVALAPRVKVCCADHLSRAKINITARLAERSKFWEEIE